MKKSVVVRAGASLFLTALVFCCLIIGGYVGYYFLPYSIAGTDNSQVEGDTIVELPVNNQLVQYLYAVPMNSALAHNSGSEFADFLYKKDVTLVSEFSNELLLSIAYSQLEELPSLSNSGTFIASENIEDAFSKIFGAVSFENADFQDGCSVWKYSATDKNYYLDDAACTIEKKSERVNKIVKAVKTEDSIEIYDIVAYVDLETQSVYSDSALTKKVANYEGKFEIDSYASKLKKYKYTFRLSEDTNYYFYSSELVK